MSCDQFVLQTSSTVSDFPADGRAHQTSNPARWSSGNGTFPLPESQGEGVLEHDAAHSSDQWWTLDVRLTSFSIDGVSAPANRYVRIEVEKGVPANAYVDQAPFKRGEQVLFRGPIRVRQRSTTFP